MIGDVSELVKSLVDNLYLLIRSSVGNVTLDKKFRWRTVGVDENDVDALSLLSVVDLHIEVSPLTRWAVPGSMVIHRPQWDSSYYTQRQQLLVGITKLPKEK